ncbi:unnamed protein product [Rotaria sordida]|uniref:Mono(ADP-ribosyl)transferase n=1 Tax=Rotaria sordida TaxID=392033 RepID=A0A814BRX0_9BILA|nr:unnamed protein product [Rotaria sordida]CAF0845698.1 unnamed protein product [Rotaria sordida]CAF0931968.1 unnamed protein product [Rotaria sordida]CAF1120632.1 unnamed protein product [Rotaria sordida]CAF3633487.1 unnamed protein product [Rotaria sordida]
MATANALFDSEDDEDTNNLRYFDIPYAANKDKQFLSSILNSPLLQIEEAIKPLVHLIDDIATKVYIIKQQSTVDDTSDLTLDELGAIHLYIGERLPPTKCIYYLLNETIRRGFPEELQLWHPYLNLLLTALGKLPSTGHHCTVYRGVRSCDLSDEYKNDGRYTWWTFGSCLRSLDQMKLPTFLGKQGVRTIFKIDCYSGKRLPWSEDDEVILMPGFHFQVIGKLRSLDDLNTIYVREIPPSSTEIMSPVPVVTTVEHVEPLSLVVETKQRQKSAMELRKSFKNTAHRIIKMSKVLDVCSDHILELSGKKLPIDGLKHSLNERLTQDITILNLSKTNLTKAKVKVVAEVLRKNSTLIELNLSYNPFGNAGCLLIAQTLHGNKHLITLNLYNTKLSCDAGQYLAEMLSLNHHLRSLHLGVNSLGNLGIKYLLNGNIQLHHLNLCCNKIDQDGCQYLADFLEKNQTLKQFDVGGNPIKDKGIKILCNSLMSNKTLIDLHMWHCQISNLEGICNLLKSHSTLAEMDLEGNQITDEHADGLLLALETNKTLEKLNISDSKISDKFKKKFQQLAIVRLSIILQ